MNTIFNLDWTVSPIDVNYDFGTNQIFKIPLGFLSTGGGGDALVFSVNNKIGNVVLNAADVGAEPLGSVESLRQSFNSIFDLKADLNYVNQQIAVLSDVIVQKTSKSYVDQQDATLQDQIDLKANAQAVNQALSTKADLVGGVIPASQLPSFVDDVLEYLTLALFPVTGESGKIYIATDTNKTYRWSGSTYVEVGGGSSGVSLGETESTAYRGDRGKAAYDHSQSQGNPHNTTTALVTEQTNLYFTEPRVLQTLLNGFVTSSGSISSTDSVITAFGKLQGSINSISGYTDAKVRAATLTGLNVASAPANAITEADSVLFAFAKVQAQLNLVGAPVWVSATTIGDFDSTYFNPQFTQLEFCRSGGMLMVRGWVNMRALNASGLIFGEITNPKYKIINPYNVSSASGYIEVLYAGNATNALTQQFEVFSNGIITNSSNAATARQFIRNLVVVNNGTLGYIRPQYLGILADPT